MRVRKRLDYLQSFYLLAFEGFDTFVASPVACVGVAAFVPVPGEEQAGE